MLCRTSYHTQPDAMASMVSPVHQLCHLHVTSATRLECECPAQCRLVEWYAVATAIKYACSQDLDDAWAEELDAVFKKKAAFAFAKVCPDTFAPSGVTEYTAGLFCVAWCALRKGMKLQDATAKGCPPKPADPQFHGHC
jgi:hypothetical protein